MKTREPRRAGQWCWQGGQGPESRGSKLAPHLSLVRGCPALLDGPLRGWAACRAGSGMQV